MLIFFHPSLPLGAGVWVHLVGCLAVYTAHSPAARNPLSFEAGAVGFSSGSVSPMGAGNVSSGKVWVHCIVFVGLSLSLFLYLPCLQIIFIATV